MAKPPTIDYASPPTPTSAPADDRSGPAATWCLICAILACPCISAPIVGIIGIMIQESLAAVAVGFSAGSAIASLMLGFIALRRIYRGIDPPGGEENVLFAFVFNFLSLVFAVVVCATFFW